jgi:hypothetical protein
MILPPYRHTRLHYQNSHYTFPTPQIQSRLSILERFLGSGLVDVVLSNCREFIHSLVVQMDGDRPDKAYLWTFFSRTADVSIRDFRYLCLFNVFGAFACTTSWTDLQ